VSEELWTQCNRLLEEQLKKKPGKQPAHTYAGLTYCSCGAKMYVPSSSPKYCCFRKGCGNKIPVADLDGIFYEELKTFFLRPERVTGHLQAASENVTAKERLLEIQRNDIERVRDEMAKTHKLYLAGQIPLEGFGSLYNPQQERLTQLQTERAKLEAEVAHLTINHVSADEVMSEARALYSRWPTLENGSKRKIVESITEKIVIGTDNNIEITLSYLPSSEEATKSQQRLPAAVAELGR
jgi:site-specific DNA recombinase